MAHDVRRMKVVPENETKERTVLVFDGVDGIPIRGKGNLSYSCGSCGKTLIRAINYKQVQDVIIKCNGCSAFNEIPPAHHSN